MILPAELLGDLREELDERLLEGERWAHAWYAGQILRSLWPIARPSLSAYILGITIPVLALDRLWAFVYSQVPLKVGLERAPEMLGMNVLACFLGALVVSRLHSPRMLSAVLAAGLSIVFSVAHVPWVYAVALLLAPVAAHLGSANKAPHKPARR
jgi:hypothetical protein